MSQRGRLGNLYLASLVFCINWPGADIALFRRIVGDDPEALNFLDQALSGRQGERTDLVDIINEVKDRPSGTTTTQALHKLRAEARVRSCTSYRCLGATNW